MSSLRRISIHAVIIGNLIWLSACGSPRATYERESLSLLQRISSLENQLHSANEQVARLTDRESRAAQQYAEAGERCRTERDSLQGQLKVCEAERISLKASEKGVLIQRINDCRQNSAKEYQRGLSAGKLSVLNSVEVVGTPQVVEGWISDDHYYQFEVRVAGRRFSLMRVRTHEEENPFGSVLASIGDLTPLVLKR